MGEYSTEITINWTNAQGWGKFNRSTFSMNNLIHQKQVSFYENYDDLIIRTS